MKIGIMSDTHNHLDRTKVAVDRLVECSVEAIFHCGDLATPEILVACSVLPFYFVFGNHDADEVPDLTRAAQEFGATCLAWGGEVELAGRRIAMTHGHLRSDLQPLLDAEPDYLLTGHSHATHDRMVGATRRINPGALFRASEFTVAILDLRTDHLQFLTIPR